jgi:hypothetical protein
MKEKKLTEIDFKNFPKLRKINQEGTKRTGLLTKILVCCVIFKSQGMIIRTLLCVHIQYL